MPPPARARRGPQDQASDPPSAQETQPQRPGQRALARERPIARAHPPRRHRDPPRRGRDATPGGQDPPQRPLPRRSPHGRRAAHPGTPRRRRRHGPADGGTGHLCRTRTAPPRSRGAAAPVLMPCSSAARHTRVGSPSGSAAAMSSSRRVDSGIAAIRRRKLSSVLLGSAEAAAVPNPASSVALRPRGARVAPADCRASLPRCGPALARPT